MRATWYLLEDGTPVDPAECHRKGGVLTHKSGAKVAMRFPDCPRSAGVDLDANGKLLFVDNAISLEDAANLKETWDRPPEGGNEPAYLKTEDMKPEPKPAQVKKPGYKTRGK